MQYGAAIVIRCFTVSQGKTAHVSAGPNVANHAPRRRFSFISSSLLSISPSSLPLSYSSSLDSHLSVLPPSSSLSPSLPLSTSLWPQLFISQSSCSRPPLPAYSAPFVGDIGYILTNSHHYTTTILFLFLSFIIQYHPGPFHSLVALDLLPCPCVDLSSWSLCRQPCS